MNTIDANPAEPRVALVTGAARRIGAAIADTLHAAGLDIAIHCRNSREQAQALADLLNARRRASAQVFACDLIESGKPAELIDSIVGWRDRLDVLVNNASTFYPTPMGRVSETDWNDLLGSNLKAPLFLSQAAVPQLKSAEGSIINIVDIHAKKPLRDHPVYCAAKAGLVMLTRSLAQDLAPEIRVNAVAPGAIAWPETGMTHSMKEHILGEIPLGRSGDPTDIATTVRFLVLEATYVTGEIIAVDGGRSIAW